MNIQITRRQKAFIDATETEVLYGGAAGGGKSYGQLIDAFLVALRYPKSKQLLLRRTFPELERSLIRTARGLYPMDVFSYNASSHTGTFANGSILDFGHLGTDGDVYQYQSAEYDVIRFDELTHFTEFQYTYLISRIRGANGYPKQMKSTTNPGGVGHSWVKARFIDPAPPNTPFVGEDGSSRVFLPAKIDDNKFLMSADPTYKERLLTQDEDTRKALLYGEWDIFSGQFFREFRREIHTCEPFPIPASWRRYRALDYGFDRLAVLWVAVAPDKRVYIYRELCESDLIISAAAQTIKAMSEGEEIYATLAPPDLWSRSQESGKGRADMFYAEGIPFTKASNDRIDGWSAVRELLAPNNEGEPRLHIFNTCTELIKCLPALVHDPRHPEDCATEPHWATHAPDALRYFAVSWTRPAKPEEERRVRYTPDQLEDWRHATAQEREYMIRKYGGRPL